MTPQEIDRLTAEALASSPGRIVVGAVIIRGKEALLLKRRQEDYLGGMYEIPSGRVEDGESLLQALERETLEETGLSITHVDGYLGCFDYPSRSGRPTRQLNFLVSVHPAPVALSEHEDFAWAGEEELSEYPLSDQTRRVVRQALLHRSGS